MKAGKRKRESLRSRRKKLMEEGERFSYREALVLYMAALGFVVFSGMCMKLRFPYMLTGLLLCMLRIPRLYYQQKKSHYEWKRFQDINAYMAQMAQSFAGSGKLLGAFRETRDTFEKGNMHSLLTKVISHLEAAKDVELAQQEGFQMIEEKYGCQRLVTLHEFVLKAESRGGSYEAEFRLLEHIRQLWERTELKFRSSIKTARNLVAVEYMMLVLVCIFMLHQFPRELAILNLSLVQALNTFLIVCFFIVFGRMDRRLCRGMLGEEKRMDMQQARRKMERIRRFQEKERLHLPWEYLGYLWNLYEIRAEIKRAFPGWLFDVLLLIQSENVAVALLKSVPKAAPVLQEEIKCLIKEIQEHPRSSEAFLSFFAGYQIPEVEGIMRKLHALYMGSGVAEEVMELMIDTNMTMLAEADAKRLKNKGDLFSVYYLIPTIPVMVCMVGYGAALMFVIFRNIMTVI